MEFLKRSLLLGSPSCCSVHWCSFCVPLQVSVPRIPGVSRPPVESWERCPSYTHYLRLKADFRLQSLQKPARKQGWIQLGPVNYSVEAQTKKLKNVLWINSDSWFWQISFLGNFQPLLNFAFMVFYVLPLYIGLVS